MTDHEVIQNVDLQTPSLEKRAKQFSKQMAESLLALIDDETFSLDTPLGAVIDKLQGKPTSYVYLIYEDNHRSMNHAGYRDEELCKKEVERLNNAARAHNEKIKAKPATGHGAVFANMEWKEKWSYRKMIVS
jgi:hypothetical protein